MTDRPEPDPLFLALYRAVRELDALDPKPPDRITLVCSHDFRIRLVVNKFLADRAVLSMAWRRDDEAPTPTLFGFPLRYQLRALMKCPPFLVAHGRRAYVKESSFPWPAS